MLNALPHVSDEFEKDLSSAFEKTVNKELLRRHALIHEQETKKPATESPNSSPKASPEN